MAMALTLYEYLEEMEAVYDVVPHGHAETSRGIARRAHVPPERLAKGVLVRDEAGTLALAVVPSDCNVDLKGLDSRMGHRVGLADADDIERIFDDCDPGAVPPVGNAYGVRVMLDDRVARLPDVYFEAGDHEALVHVAGDEFRRLVGGARHGAFSRAAGA